MLKITFDFTCDTCGKQEAKVLSRSNRLPAFEDDDQAKKFLGGWEFIARRPHLHSIEDYKSSNLCCNECLEEWKIKNPC